MRFGMAPAVALAMFLTFGKWLQFYQVLATLGYVVNREEVIHPRGLVALSIFR
jgi:hypothetical protein